MRVSSPGVSARTSFQGPPLQRPAAFEAEPPISRKRSAKVSIPAVLPATGFRGRVQRRLRTLHVAILRYEPSRPS
jgi:hypothetical protein